jgi:hypothetical protein
MSRSDSPGFHRAPICAAVLIVAALLAGWFVWSVRAAPRQEPPQAWEYLIVAGGNVNFSGSISRRKQPETVFTSEATTLEANLDRLGLQGWELVTVSGAPNNPILYLKRVKSAEK